MPDMTMLEAAKNHADPKVEAVSRWIVEASPILEYLPMKSINGAAYRYDTESYLGGIAFRGVGGSYTANNGIINPQYEGLTIMGGEVTIDRFEVKQMSNLRDLKGDRFRMKARAAGIKFSETFFEGDSAVDPHAFDGLRKRLPIGSTQALTAGVNGAALTLAKLDQLLDMVIGDNSQKVLFMNKTLRRKILALVAAENGSFRIDTMQDSFHRTQKAYSDAMIRVVEREDDGSTFLDFDEAAEDGGADCSSIYCMRFGSEFVMGITGVDGLPDVVDFGEMEARPAHLGRIEQYVGLCIKHPRACARMHSILNS